MISKKTLCYVSYGRLGWLELSIVCVAKTIHDKIFSLKVKLTANRWYILRMFRHFTVNGTRLEHCFQIVEISKIK